MLLLIVNWDSFTGVPDGLEQSKANFKKYLELTAGNIPAKTRYVNSLFYAGDYDEVIKNVEEILAVDKSRAYMNRLAGYSCYEKKIPITIKLFHIWRHFSNR